MARAKVVPPPRTRVPAADMKRQTSSRYLLAGAVVAVAGLAVWLAFGLTSSNGPASGTTTTTTTSTTISANLGTPHQQVVNSLRSAKVVTAAYEAAEKSCKNVSCDDNAAITAVDSFNTTVNLINQNTFPSTAVSSATAYVQQLQGLQSTFLQISESNTETRVTFLDQQWRAALKNASAAATVLLGVL